MTTFTINSENNITAHLTPEEAAAVTTTPFDAFSSQNELAELATAWPPERPVAIWNSLPGVKPAKGFKNPKPVAGRIWERIQRLGEPEEPKPERKPKGGAQAAKGASRKPKTSKKSAPAKKTPKTPKKAKTAKHEGVREGSKTARILELLRRPGGATVKELMKATSWQKHSLRGFVSGTLGKKMGLKVESTKREDGERVYSLSK